MMALIAAFRVALKASALCAILVTLSSAMQRVALSARA